MFRLMQPAMIRAVAHAALEQKKLTLHGYHGVMEWIDDVERSNHPPEDDEAIRKASEVMIRRLKQPSPDLLRMRPQVVPSHGVTAQLELGTP